jgi:hypothetical protein
MANTVEVKSEKPKRKYTKRAKKWSKTTAKRKTTKRGDNESSPAQDYSNHISYLFGKVETIIDHYSAGAFVPRAPLARGLAELLLHKEGGKVLGS